MATTSTAHGSREDPEPDRRRRPFGGQRTADPVRGPLGELTIAELRHPTETSRFALALTAMALTLAVGLVIMLSGGGPADVLQIIATIVVLFLALWLFVQLLRIRLVGDAVLVSRETLPDVQEVVELVRKRLAYTRRVDVFVVDKTSRVLSSDAGPVALTSFFGVHVLLVEGDAVGDLSDRKEHDHLLFTLATFVGALKARYAQWWSPLFTAFGTTGLTRFVWPFVLPYYRATVYSGDRIAYACCGDLDVSVQAVFRSLVGNQVAPHVRAEGFTGQALRARRQRVLRLAQLLRPAPHATNRYLELLAFMSRRTPEAFHLWVRTW